MMYHLFLLTICLTTVRAGIWDVIEGFTSYLPLIPSQSQDAFLNINQLAAKYGYPLENHTVTTEDGYILTMHRMPYGKNRIKGGKPVFLMHGISDCSDSWLLLGPGKALAYILADRGYDVWMGNARGNRHSNIHNSYNNNSKEYWNFSWEEIGLYDLPAMIDYTLNYTKKERIYYVGYSQGTTTYFVLTSMKPEYNDKISIMFALAPEVFMGNITSPYIRLLSPANGYLNTLLSYFNIYSSGEDLLNIIGPMLCNLFLMRCDNFYYTLLGPNNVKESMWPIILGHAPTGSSTMQFMHYGQLVNSNRFCRFDYGTKTNLKLYGRKSPPDYDLSKVTSPIVFFYGGNDWLSNIKDVEKLNARLPNKEYMCYYLNKFGHSDYVYADEAKELVYENILKHLQEDEFNAV